MACIRTDLISGASAVSLVPRPEDYSAQIVLRPRPALRRFSVPDCWAGPVNKATVCLSSCTSSTPCFLFCPAWAYSACVLFAVLFQRRCALSRPRSILRFSFRLLHSLRGLSQVTPRTRLCYTTTPETSLPYITSLLPRARMRATGLSDWFCPSVTCQSVCLSSEKF